MAGLQELIHRLEEGGGVRTVRYLLALFLFVALAVVYDVKCFRNFSTEEAMDTAQLARNIAAGRGYTTDYLRPASLALIKANSPDQTPQLANGHPDLANPPVYPYLLAGWMKVVPMKHVIVDPRKGLFRIHQPELMIAILNQILLLASVVALFLLARSLFDEQVAWLSVAVYAGTGLYWRFSVSGLSSSLLVLILLLLSGCLLWLERRGRDESEAASWRSVLLVSMTAGALLGLGFLTRYAFGWILIPVVGFAFFFVGRYRVLASVTILVMTLAISTPWLARNHRLSGNFFGTAGYALVEGTSEIPDQRLIRSLSPDEVANKVGLKSVVRKLVVNLRDIVQNDLPRLGGNWIGAFFLVGLMIRFGDPSRGRLRLLILGFIVTLALVQALGRTQLAVDSLEINSENLLVLVAPLVFLFGVVFFLMLLEELALALPTLRWLFFATFLLITSMPLLLSFMPPQASAVAYPPFYPPIIQEVAGWMRPGELMMSDVPCGVAWYGHRQCSALTDDSRAQFFRLNDEFKSVKALYLTPLTLDVRFASQMIKEKNGWGSFLLETLTQKASRQDFPLKIAAPRFFPDQFFLTDWERWKMKSP